jgi:predicted dehydrogenase
MKAISIGVIGCGHWGPNHIRTFSNLPGAVVLMAADLSQSRLNQIGQLYNNIILVQDYNQILTDPSIDAVVVATPTKSHYAIVKDALLAKKHVLVEKPLCLRADEGQELLQLAASQQVILMVGQIFLFNNGILKLKEYLNNEEVGQIYYIGAARTNLGPIRQDVNAVYDLASHDIAIFNFLLDAVPLEASAVGQAILQPGIEDLAFISLRYPQQIVARIHVSWLDPRKTREITIVGDKKMLFWDELAAGGPIQIYDKGVVREPYYDDYGQFQLLTREGDITIPRVKLEEPLKNQARDFLASIAQRQVIRSDGNSGLAVVRVLEAIQASLQERGKPMAVAQA